MKDCISFKKAKGFHELGIRFDPEYVWVVAENFPDPILYHNELVKLEDHHKLFGKWTTYVAVTTGQMLERLPNVVVQSAATHAVHQLVIEKQATQYAVMYICADCVGKKMGVIAPTLPDALADMLIHMHQNRMLNPY